MTAEAFGMILFLLFSAGHERLMSTVTIKIYDWIFENWPNSHTRPIHFIGPANGYSCTLHIHRAITSLDWLVWFCRASFADSVNSILRQWDPWRMLHGRHGSKMHPRDRKMSLTPSKHVWAYGWHFWNWF